MEKMLIILDYRNAKVSIMPNKGARHEEMEDQLSEWCKNNETSLSDCEWMGWDGVVRYEE